MNDPKHTDHTSPARATVAVAATYIYFLLFAEFAFLELARSDRTSPVRLRLVMTLLGLGGIFGSIAPAYFKRVSNHRLALRAGFIACAAAAALALNYGPGWIDLAAFLTGGAAGWVTVLLATRLKQICGESALPWVCGLGTGSAYAICNLPFIFQAAPQVQASVAGGVAVLGAFAAPLPKSARSDPVARVPQRFRTGVIAAFFALVWLDSAAFYIIQHHEALRSVTWWSGNLLFGGAIVHFFGAVAAAYLLKRNLAGAVLICAAACLAMACYSLRSSISPAATSLIYNSGVSLYSTALVWWPAKVRELRFSGLLYSISGWLSSALAIGMAQDLHRVPVAVGVAAFAVVATSAGFFVDR